MKLKTVPLMLSLLLLSSPVAPIKSAAADSDEVFTITFLDFDGNIMNIQNLKSGEAINYSEPDTDSLKFNVNAFTQRMFSEWDMQPEFAVENTTIQALYKEAAISLDSTPSKTLYNFDDGAIDLSGLQVTITIFTQTRNFDSNGNRIITQEKTDISSTCTLSPNNTQEAFEKDDTAEIKIYPIASSVPVGSYEINLNLLRGDINFDGVIDAVDASMAEHHYASISMGVYDGFTDLQQRAADFNRDGFVDSSDACDILAYYANNISL